MLKHGIVHEAHSQNVLVVVDENRVRLLLRDLDSCLVDPDLGSSVTQGLAERLTDHRLIAKDPVDLAAMFVTTTLHQCVASVLISTATALGRPVTPLLAQVRPLLLEIAESHPDARDTALLTSGIARAERLPVKRTLTAATLLPKSRTGAADVNKFYGADAPPTCDADRGPQQSGATVRCGERRGRHHHRPAQLPGAGGLRSGRSRHAGRGRPGDHPAGEIGQDLKCRAAAADGQCFP